MSTRYISLTIGNKVERQYGGMSKEECMEYVQQFLKGDIDQELLNSWNIIKINLTTPTEEYNNVPNVTFPTSFKLKIMKRNGSKSKHGVIIQGTIKRFSQVELKISGISMCHLVIVEKIEEVRYSSNKELDIPNYGDEVSLDDIIIKYIKERSSL